MTGNNSIKDAAQVTEKMSEQTVKKDKSLQDVREVKPSYNNIQNAQLSQNEESVKKLDTIHFNQIINTFAAQIRSFETIRRGVDLSVIRVLNNWKGEGSKAFEKDSKQIQVNLNDICDIMYDMRDVLIDAHAGFMETDNALSKSFDSV